MGQDLLSQKIKINPGKYSLIESLKIVENQGVELAYSSDILPETTCVFEKSELTLNEFLTILKKATGIDYNQTGNRIIIKFLSTPRQPTKNSIKGIFRDKETGEVLIGATLQEVKTSLGVVTNKYGYYSLTLEQGLHIIKASFIGYESIIDTVQMIKKDKTINFHLLPAPRELKEVTISALDPEFNIKSLIPGTNTLELNTKGQIPYFLGEVDVLQGMVLLPGISSMGEDASGLNIRGGSVDQNLILLDEATVYNPNHFYGLISVFNPETVNHVDIMKGFIPPSFGGRTSSIITVHQKEGNNRDYHFTGGIGLVSARFIAEGPIKREQSSFLISGRQSLLNLSLDDNNTQANFQDLNTKVNWKVDKRNTLFVSGYFGNDQNKNAFNRVRSWGNRNISARWNHLFGPKIFGNFSAIISEYNYRVSQPQEAASFIGESRIIDYTIKSDLGYVISPKHKIDFGGSAILHRLKPGDRKPFEENTSSSKPLFLDSEHGLESALYVSHEAHFGKWFSTLYGFRASSMINLGPGKSYIYRKDVPKSDATILDTLTFGRNQRIATFYNIEPRISTILHLGTSQSIKASYSRTYQYLHLISNTVVPLPTDIWKLSDRHIPPTYADHFSLGYYQNFNDNKFEGYVETYFKKMNDLLEYKDGADLLFNENPETELLSGQGLSYGLEFFVKKNTGNFTGWLSYTLSKSVVLVSGNFPEETVNYGFYFPANHDREHDLSLVGIYEFNHRISASLSFNYNSGRPYTLPTGKYEYEDISIPNFELRNQERLPDYHRLDLSVKLSGKKYRKNGKARFLEDYWTLVVYNVYGRDNVHSYSYVESDVPGVSNYSANTIFDTVIPAITYHFKF